MSTIPFMRFHIDRNLEKILRCGKKCICYNNIKNDHLKFKNNDIIKIFTYSFYRDKKWCFTNYDGTKQFKYFEK
tara:strand:- start:1147 stop:1368 length:222 start_codon:yes stop_codon:yes gene_type:complete